MGLAHPLRRCAGLSVLGLEVFRSPSLSTRSENRMPSPSLSSGATPEYDHSRQSIDPRVRPRVAPTLSGLHVARWRTAAHIELSIGGAPSTDDPIRRPNHSMQHPAVPLGAISEETAPSEERWAEVTARTRRPEPDRPERSLSAEAGSVRYRAPSGRGGKPPSTIERARGCQACR
jgi:hypothetical protein